MAYNSEYNYRTILSDLLAASNEWSFGYTFNCRYEIEEEQANKAFSHLLNLIDRKIYPKSKDSKTKYISGYNPLRTTRLVHKEYSHKYSHWHIHTTWVIPDGWMLNEFTRLLHACWMSIKERHPGGGSTWPSYFGNREHDVSNWIGYSDKEGSYEHKLSNRS